MLEDRPSGVHDETRTVYQDGVWKTVDIAHFYRIFSTETRM